MLSLPAAGPDTQPLAASAPRSPSEEPDGAPGRPRSPQAPPLRARLRSRTASREGRPRPAGDQGTSGRTAGGKHTGQRRSPSRSLRRGGARTVRRPPRPTEGSRAGPFPGRATCCCVGVRALAGGAQGQRLSLAEPAIPQHSFAGLPWPHRRRPEHPSSGTIVPCPGQVHRGCPGIRAVPTRAGPGFPHQLLPGHHLTVCQRRAACALAPSGERGPAVHHTEPHPEGSRDFKGIQTARREGKARVPPPRPVQSGRRWRPGLGKGWPCPGGGERSREPGAGRQAVNSEAPTARGSPLTRQRPWKGDVAGRDPLSGPGFGLWPGRGRVQPAGTRRRPPG